MLAAGVDDIDHAAHADIEHQIGLAVEKFGAVDESQMMHLVHALGRDIDCGGVTDVAADEFDVFLDRFQPARAAARIVVEHAHARAGFHQRLDQSRTDEA